MLQRMVRLQLDQIDDPQLSCAVISPVGEKESLKAKILKWSSYGIMRLLFTDSERKISQGVCQTSDRGLTTFGARQ